MTPAQRPERMPAEALLLSEAQATVECVALERSFSAASRRLGVAQSTASRRIRQLEDELGVSLFERTAGGVRVTEAGSVFVGRLQQVRDLVGQAIEEARAAGRAASGQLSVGYVCSFSAGNAMHVLQAFRTQAPQIRPRLVEAGGAELYRLVLARQLDCAWTAGLPALSARLRSEPLWSEQLYVAAPPGLLPAGPADWTVFARIPYLCRAGDEWRSIQPWLDSVGGPTLTIRTHDCSRESLLALVAAGDGATVVPESIAAGGIPGVDLRPLSDDTARVHLHAIYRREADNPVLRRFLSVTRDWLGRRRSV